MQYDNTMIYNYVNPCFTRYYSTTTSVYFIRHACRQGPQ